MGDHSFAAATPSLHFSDNAFQQSLVASADQLELLLVSLRHDDGRALIETFEH
jgi:hypothetical protein